MKLKFLLLSLSLCLNFYTSIYSQSSGDYFLISLNTGINGYSYNYDKIDFFYSNIQKNVFLHDSIPFDKTNITARTGFSFLATASNNLAIEVSGTSSLPAFDKMHMKKFSIGAGYSLNLNDKLYIIPMLAFERDKHYFIFDEYKGPPDALYVNNVNMGTKIDIRYKKKTYCLTPKVSINIPFNIREKNLFVGIDCCYSYRFGGNERVIFRDTFFETGKVWSDLLVILFRNLSAEKTTPDKFLYSNAQPIHQSVLTPKNLFLNFKVGYVF